MTGRAGLHRNTRQVVPACDGGVGCAGLGWGLGAPSLFEVVGGRGPVPTDARFAKCVVVGGRGPYPTDGLFVRLEIVVVTRGRYPVWWPVRPDGAVVMGSSGCTRVRMAPVEEFLLRSCAVLILLGLLLLLLKILLWLAILLVAVPAAAVSIYEYMHP